MFVICAEAVLLLIMKPDFETQLYFKTISKILAVGTSASTAGNGESESRTPFARTRNRTLPYAHPCTTPDPNPSNMHNPSAAAAKTREPEHSKTFPNRHNGDFRYVKLYKKIEARHMASRALRG
jgi:hypothetical protein